MGFSSSWKKRAKKAEARADLAEKRLERTETLLHRSDERVLQQHRELNETRRDVAYAEITIQVLRGHNDGLQESLELIERCYDQGLSPVECGAAIVDESVVTAKQCLEMKAAQGARA